MTLLTKSILVPLLLVALVEPIAAKTYDVYVLMMDGTPVTFGDISLESCVDTAEDLAPQYPKSVFSCERWTVTRETS